jgi:hypothetical protein
VITPTDDGTRQRYKGRTNTKRKSRRQARQDTWQQKPVMEIKTKYRSFQKGALKFKKRIAPSHEDLSRSTQHGQTMLDNPHYYEPNGDSVSSNRLALAKDHECREMQRTIELLEDGGIGYMPEKKTHGWVRIMFENWNSLGILTQSWKFDRLNYLVKSLNIDIVAGCECQTDWSKVDTDNQFHSLLAPGRAKKGIASHNNTERIHRDQPGGTAITGVGRICDVIQEVGSDKTGLGRWSWITLHGGTTTTRIISAYLPRRPNRHSKGRTVWEQHTRYFQQQGDMRYPSTIFIVDLLRLIKSWISLGEHVILAMDANQDVYSGKLAQALATEPINMKCLMEKAIGEKVPNSHFSGKGQISTIFGSPGVVTGNGMCYPHWYGVGDHRVMVLEIAALNAFEGSYPTISTPTARILSCRTKRHRDKYCKRLRQLVEEHRMDKRLQEISSLTGDQYILAHNQWDNELGDYMRSAELHCSHYKDGSIEFSPTVGQWLRKRSILKWILRWKEGKVPDVRNLLRAAKRMHIDKPLELSAQEIEARLVSCINAIYDLRHKAPSLRDKHLKWRLTLAYKREDDAAVQEINRIRRNEAQKRRQRTINRAIKDPKGQAVLQVDIPTQTGGTCTLDTQQEVEHHVRQNLQQRFSLGKRAPFNRGRLLADFGTLGDTEAVTQLFKGNYNPHSNIDQATADYLSEAARIQKDIATLPPIPTEVTPEEYISFWSKAKENTSSSKSGRHFGHYKAISSDPDLVALHLTSINHAATRGSPLLRWSNGVTVLLEKVAGTRRIEKLRAICLLEADFNWWLKVIFARRMMYRMKEKGAIPLEQGAVKGKTTTSTTLIKQLYFDQANILHENCALASTDAANCYDAVNHAAASIALHAVGVPRELIQCYLRCIQHMRYYLRTGYGLSTTSYGSSQDSICMGLTQGSGASPAVWTAVSTVIIGAYKHRGYGAQLVGGWSQDPIAIAALLYVDDTDLLHNIVSTQDDQEMLVPWVQQATTHWANLLQATGGNLNPAKCYWYLLQYKFEKGEASLTSKRQLLDKHLTIPQPNGSEVEITLKDPTEPSEVLGVLVSPTGDGEPMLQHMVDKGYKWSRRVLNSKLQAKDAWFSFRTQAIMSVKYGLVPLMASWSSIEHTVSKWYYHCLPALGVNRSIGHEWRMLPVEYQGLGLPNLALEKLAESLQLIQHHWSRRTKLGQALRLAFELVQVETGLRGNFLLRNYDTYGRLATHTWFKQLWEMVHHFRVEVVLADEFIVPPIRENDKVLMEEVLQMLPYHQWVPFNRARKYFQIYFLSHLVMCDGSTVNPSAVEPSFTTHRSTSMRFPKEQPTDADFDIWKHTIRRLTSPTLTLSPPLGRFLRTCPEYDTWQTNTDRSYIVQQNNDTSYRVYYPAQQHYRTRGHNYFEYHHTTPHPPPCTLTASVLPHNTYKVVLHSTSSLKQVTHAPTEPFLTKLQKGLQSLIWRSSKFDEDGEWIVRAIKRGTLLIVHDGSYMPQIDKSICSAGIVLLCTQTGRMGTMQCCEKTNSTTASNYRGELLGALLASHILTIASEQHISNRTVKLYCDNLGVINHALHPESTLKTNQPQADILLMFTHNLATTTVPWSYQHVYGHLDETIRFQSLSLPEQLNVMADKLAKDALLEAVETGQYCKPYFPHESIRLLVNRHKATTSIKAHLYKEWGREVAKDLFHQKQIIQQQHFDYVHWDGLRLAMTQLPQMYKVWVTKHVSSACATNRHLSKMDSRVLNKCSCCGRRNESILHITRCTNEGRRLMFQQTVQELVQWMARSHGHPEIILAVESYLTHRGRVPMKRICQDSSILRRFARETDQLGWRNFTEARISTTLFTIQEGWLKQRRSKWHMETWTQQFLTKILDITHKQWSYRNSRIHIRQVEGLSLSEHENILQKVESLIGTDPMELLPQHHSLLQVNFESLGEGTSTDRQYWIAQMESAIKARKRRRDSYNVDLNTKQQRR